ncbi:MAG: hypothetical protein GY777_29455 [Candidatus Brocadiaceae bacterium]|nr:hypothetical protein [Candidatus Brocadiaceae bacterium]
MGNEKIMKLVRYCSLAFIVGTGYSFATHECKLIIGKVDTQISAPITVFDHDYNIVSFDTTQTSTFGLGGA